MVLMATFCTIIISLLWRGASQVVLVVKNPPDAADTGDEGKFSSCLEQTVKAQRGGSIQLSQADSVIESRVILGDAALNSVSSVVSDSLRPHGLKHARPPCPSSTPGVNSSSYPLSSCCHPTISSSVVPFSSRHLSQHQSLFKWVNSSHQMAKVL